MSLVTEVLSHFNAFLSEVLLWQTEFPEETDFLSHPKGKEIIKKYRDIFNELGVKAPESEAVKNVIGDFDELLRVK